MTGRFVARLLLLVLGVLSAAYAYLVYIPTDSPVPPLTTDGRQLSAVAGGVLSAVCLLIALVLSFAGRAKPAAATPAPVAQPETVVIKRTPMEWGGMPTGDAEGETASRLEDVNARIGRLKVQYGLGQISNEGYTRLMEELEAERAQIEGDLYRRSAPG